jgi:hypothetical protein
MDKEALLMRLVEKLLCDGETTQTGSQDAQTSAHPMLGKMCVVRTYSAGVHIGRVDYVSPENAMECKLRDGWRLWKWTGGGLSLSAVAINGIKGGRLNKEPEIFLTNAIEYIPVTDKALKTYSNFVEDDENSD